MNRFGEPIAVETYVYPARTSDHLLSRTTLKYPDLVFDVNEDENSVFCPGEVVTGEAHMEITFEFGESNLVTRIVLENIKR